TYPAGGHTGGGRQLHRRLPCRLARARSYRDRARGRAPPSGTYLPPLGSVAATASCGTGWSHVSAATGQMRQAVFRGPGQLDVEQSTRPNPGPGDILVRVAACGVCGSDRAIFTGKHPATRPNVLGHEFSGTVVERGALVTELEPGDRVTVDPNVVCGRCRYC